jgi:type II secretory pathway component GspD/PulD (secretin)
MIRTNNLRAALSSRWLSACLLCCLMREASGQESAPQAAAAGAAAEGSSVQQAPVEAAQGAAAKPEDGAAEISPATFGSAHAEATPSKRQLREAQNAYFAGAKKLEHDELDGAEQQFQRALKLDPENRNYALAISVARQHRLTELVQQATKARQAGEPQKAETLLAEARAIDPESPIVLEHSGPFAVSGASGMRAIAAAAGQADAAGGRTLTPVADRTLMLEDPDAKTPWRIEAPLLAGAVKLQPSNGVKSFHSRGDSQSVLHEVGLAYGIRVFIDDSVERKILRFDLENVNYEQAMSALMSMAHVFAVPVDETSVIIARDDVTNRQRLERQIEETIFIPGTTTEQLNELATVIRTVFDVRQTTVQTSLGNIVVRAPEDVLEPMNLALKDLMESPGELMVDVKMYEVDKTRSINVGATIPTAFGVVNLEAAATQLVNSNQALVQQAIAQGFIKATDSNITVALALLASGLVQSPLIGSLLGTFGGGVLMTGVTETGGATFNLGQNSSDTRALDDVQLRVGDRQPATFRQGIRYPITTSTYSTGLSTAASALGNQTINGVSVANLLSQFAGGTSATIPQVTYEDLGITLKATPTIQNTGRINLLLDLKIEALGSGSANGIPVLDNRQFASDLTVADGESVLMVSNVSRSESAAMTGLPGLSELPGFQAPLSDSAEKDTSQLVVVVTPHIVRRRVDLVAGPRIPVRAN